MRLIDGDALRDALGITGTADSCKGCKYNDRFGFACNTDNAPDFAYVCELIDDAPTIEERKKGRWTDDNACPFCGFHPWYERDIHTLSYCPNCGADMRGEQDEH